MSVEQINLIQLQGLLPTVIVFAELMLACVVVWFLVLGVAILLDFLMNKILKKGAR